MLFQSPRAGRARSSARRPLLALRNRRGVMAVMFGILLLTFLMFAAVAIDFSRLFVTKNELQTAADAGAVAAAKQILEDPSMAVTAAKLQIAANGVLGDDVDSATAVITPGVWDDELHTFTEVGTWISADAVRVTVREPATYHIAQVFGGAHDGDVVATAIAWSGASVKSTDDCVKPWAIPYTKLTEAIDPLKDPYRDLDADDRRRVQEYVATGQNKTELAFTLHQGTGAPEDNAGNFYNVVLPPRCTVDDKSCDPNATQNRGASDYYRNIYNPDDPGGCANHKLTVGDVLETQPGVSPQQTVNRALDFCEAQTGVRDCAGVAIKAAFWSLLSDETIDWVGDAGWTITQEDKDAGRFPVETKITGSFIITSLSVDQSDKGQPKSKLDGYFTMLDDGGNIGRSITLLQRPILVR